MKSKIAIAIVFAMLFGPQIHAQSLLESIGRSIRNEVKKEVTKKQGQQQKQPAPKPAVSATDVPITQMETWQLVVKDGKPHYKFIGSSAESKVNYYLDDIQYEHPDGVQPFTFTTAVATFKTKEGYYFDKALKLNDRTSQAENTTGFKRIDAHTVKVYLMAFTGAMGYDVRITPAMVEYKNKINELNISPIATAQINAPLFDHWYKKRRYGDNITGRFIENNMRAYYAYPTTEERRHIDGNMVMGAEKTSFPGNITIVSIDVYDDDLSDDIPGLVGEWCLISKKRFIPKACLKDIKYGAKYGGAPATLVNSPFVFAGGSGTLEDPYLVQTAEQLNAVRQGPKNHYKLIADIDLSKWGNWVPIGGTYSYGFMGSGWNKAEEGAFSFQGSFDGNGHVISGMQIVINEETPFLTETGNWRAYGLFASLATNPDDYMIKNLGVVNFNIDVNYTNVKKNLDLYAAPIVGGMNNGTDIVNCYSKGGKIRINVRGNEAFKGFDKFGDRPDGAPHVNIRVGGICSDGGGVFGGHGNQRKTHMHIERCFNGSDITVDVQNSGYVIYAGGIIGTMDTSHIHECYNNGNITLPMGLDNPWGSWHESVAAGICAYASIPEIPNIYHKQPEDASFIQNCYNAGQITARGSAGIFYYSVSDIHLENCYNVGAIIGNEFDNGNGFSTVNTIFSDVCGIKPYGKEFVRNCTGNGNSVTGPVWGTSSVLGRKVLAAIPEDTHPSNVYDVDPGNIGTFTDVKADVWYADAVKWALDKGIISGTTFFPEKTCTRAQLMTFLWRAAGSPEMSVGNPFSDVKATDEYYAAALWASEKGLVSGSAFAPQTSLARGEFVISLWKCAGSPEGWQANQYLDIESHQSDFGKAVAWAHFNSVMAGAAKYKFSSDKTCTRAQVINYMYRALK